MQNPQPPAPIRILIVDDDAIVRRLIQVTLTNIECLCTEAHNGYEALELAGKRPFDIILLDIMMPGLNGFEVCSRLKANDETADIPVVLVTALNSADSRQRGKDAGADDFISKPFTKPTLLGAIENALSISLLDA